jgi:predicted  nucleic acid-binding Zn-ribbon protein
MEWLETLATAGGPTGLVATIVMLFLKKEKRESARRDGAHQQRWANLSQDVHDLKNKAENVQTDLSDIKIQIAKISTALDIFVMDKKVVKN